ncbi:hypothetical protein ACJ41O_014039 [Fusarium nematophilum]
MGREKRSLPAAVVGGPKERHRRAQRSQYDPTAPVPQGFVAKPAQPKTKHHTYFEFVENKDKKKKLEFQITTKKTPPPGFEYVPAGNPELTTACKELSREKDAMIFIVSSFLKNAKEDGSNILAHQVHRSGHHIRATIVEEARAGLGQTLNRKTHASGGLPEPIPKSQEEYDRQVDAALRDLFPRIPNTDRQIIIEHAFRRGATFKGEKPVGLSTDITLARRVQLAVLAHIRHTHTRYDTLLKETTWQNARKVVEALCLDTLVKWRGDEESGRDQLDEILREVVVISDSEGEDSDEESDDSSIAEVEPPPMPTAPSRLASNTSGQVGPGRRQSPRFTSSAKGPATPVRGNGKVKKAKRKTSAEKKGQRGFKRYHQAWQEALQRSREEQDPAPPTPVARNHQYSHAPPPGGPASYRGDEFPTASQLRITLDRAGPAPNENGQPVLRHEQDFASSHNGSRLGVGPAYRNDARPHGMHDPAANAEGPRIIRETQGAAGVEIIPISRAHPHEIRPRPIAEPPRPLFPTTGGHGDAWRYVERGPAPGHQDAPGLEARPIASDRLEPRYEPYQEIRHDQRPPAGYQQQEPMQRQYRNEPLAPDNRPRAYPLHPHQPENIIVLE